VIDADFVSGADHGVLSAATATLTGLIGEGSIIRRGEGEQTKEVGVRNFHEAMQCGATKVTNSVQAALQGVARWIRSSCGNHEGSDCLPLPLVRREEWAAMKKIKKMHYSSFWVDL
jgi:hypothetical protein